jgi:hypothetical protein
LPASNALVFVSHCCGSLLTWWKFYFAHLQVDWDDSSPFSKTRSKYVNAWQVQFVSFPPLLKRLKISDTIAPLLMVWLMKMLEKISKPCKRTWRYGLLNTSGCSAMSNAERVSESTSAVSYLHIALVIGLSLWFYHYIVKLCMHFDGSTRTVTAWGLYHWFVGCYSFVCRSEDGWMRLTASASAFVPEDPTECLYAAHQWVALLVSCWIIQPWRPR